MGSRESPDLMRDRIRQLFPRLQSSAFDVTSPRDARYNCVAWAANDTRRWWWPGEALFSFWPAGIAREESVTNFIAAFATLGYEVATTGDHDPNYEKLAIFATDDGTPTHMARQLSNGSWSSKLGGLEDISHVDVTGVAGSDYGQAVAFLQRRKSSST